MWVKGPRSEAPFEPRSRAADFGDALLRIIL
jgi:hypothetical protein